MLGQSWWVADFWQSPGGPVLVCAWVLWVIGSITLHELSHGWAAIRCGDRTPIETGHMTWNPLVHMGGMSLIFSALIGIAWGAMPVNPYRFRGRFDDAIVAAAGPMMNLTLAAAAAVLYGVWTGLAGGYWVEGLEVPGAVYANVHTVLGLGVTLNIVLAVFNLLPMPPLDGSRILGRFVPAYERMIRSEHGQWIALFGFLALFLLGAPYIWTVGFGASGAVLDAVVRVLAPGAAG